MKVESCFEKLSVSYFNILNRVSSHCGSFIKTTLIIFEINHSKFPAMHVLCYHMGTSNKCDSLPESQPGQCTFKRLYVTLSPKIKWNGMYARMYVSHIA